MTRIAFFVTCGSVLCLGAGTQATADPVRITSGSIVLSEPHLFQGGPIRIAGTRGFSIEGFVDTSEGAVDPLRQCFPCEPTAHFSVGANLASSAIIGSATLDGKRYQDINTSSSNNFSVVQLTGTTVLPPVNGSSLVIRAPFTMTNSSFTYELTPGSDSEPPELATVALRGGGTASVSFHANPSLPVWEFSGMRYDFAPTPEPSTLFLLGGGLAALWRARTRRTGSSHPVNHRLTS
jgi:hypothetical protein